MENNLSLKTKPRVMFQWHLLSFSPPGQFSIVSPLTLDLYKTVFSIQLVYFLCFLTPVKMALFPVVVVSGQDKNVKSQDSFFLDVKLKKH